MSGIYIHIPFCRQACHYCNFHFSTSSLLKNEMINAITQEIALSASLAAESEKHIETIYFGGGTPSLLHNHEIGDLLSAVRTNYLVSKNAEITIEANPDDISAEILTGWLASGINRLSIGVQSFKEADLLWMNRAHNSGQAMKCLDMIADAGFANYSADLIYGSPGLSDSEWESHLALMIQKNVPHLACYALTVEPKTPLAKLIRLNK
ncbi:MAG: radical SAM protein, partial [Ginsengibacter sp.]